MRPQDCFLGWKHVLFLSFLCLATSAKNVTLAWDPSTELDVISYNLYYGETASGPSILSTRIPQITIPNLLAGHSYYFYVTAVNSAGLESDPSEQIDYTVPFSQPVGTLHLEAPVMLGDQVILSAQGTAGQTYTIQTAQSIDAATWSELGRVVAGPDGLIEYAATRGAVNSFFKLLKL
jgi:hypothetical protein